MESYKRTIYRLEDKDGNGPFFYKNGQLKTNKDVKFNDKGFYAFNNISYFYDDSYIEFLLSPEYTLYKIIINKKPIFQNLRQTVFEESDVESKIPMLTPC